MDVWFLVGAILLGYWRFLLTVFFVGLIVLGFILARVNGWKVRLKVGLMVLLLVLYGLTIILQLLDNVACIPRNRETLVEVNAIRLVLVLAAVCGVTAAILVRRRAFAMALACLAVPIVVWIPIASVIHLLIPGKYICSYSMLM